MFEFLENFTKLDIHHLNAVLIIGLAVFAGVSGGKIFRKLHIPQVIGYVAIGIILGPVLKIIPADFTQISEPFSLFALGIIGFVIGGELKKDIFVKYGMQVFYILLFEGVAAYVFAGVLCFLTMLVFFDWHIALAAGVVLGAICSATDPAATCNVLWEYKSRGPLTTMLITIVALDDALAMILYITSVGVAGVLTGRYGQGEFMTMVISASYEIFGSLAMGVLMGLLLRWIISRISDREMTLIFAVGSIIATVGLALNLKLDVILSSMAFGATLVNIAPRKSAASFELVQAFAPPVYVLFFVMIGARLNLSGVTAGVSLVVAAYIIGTVAGKALGSYWGAVYSKAAKNIRRYLGFCLYQQGTVAIALLVMACSKFTGQVRDVMFTTVIAGLFTFQLFGPILVKTCIKKAGEAGLDVTEDDLIRRYKVREVMDAEPATIKEDTTIDEILNIFSRTDSLYYPVVDNENRLTGIITVRAIKETFAAQSIADWLLACDVARPIIEKVNSDTPLSVAIEKMKDNNLECIPVVSGEDDTLVGILDLRTLNRKLSAEVLKKHEQADKMAAIHA